MPEQRSDSSTDFLLADLEHFGESLWRNEEIGERRLNFFTTLVAAAISGLVALHTSENGVLEPYFGLITQGTLAGLLLFGVMTYLRLLQRNRVTDQYQRTLEYIRGKLARQHQDLRDYKVPQPPIPGAFNWLRGGLAETMAALNAALLFALLLAQGEDILLSAPVSFVFLVATWWLSVHARKGARTVAQKARVKPGTTIALLNEVPDVVESLGLPKDVEFVEPSEAQLVFLFVSSRAVLESQMPPAVASLAPGAALWVFFRKCPKAARLDLSWYGVWAVAKRAGMRPLGLVGVDETWSAFRLRPSRPGEDQ